MTNYVGSLTMDFVEVKNGGATLGAGHIRDYLFVENSCLFVY